MAFLPSGFCDRHNGWATWHDDEGWDSSIGPNLTFEVYDSGWGYYHESFVGCNPECDYVHIFVAESSGSGDVNAPSDEHTGVAGSYVEAGNNAHNCYP